jgi:hypothetical protein
MIGDGTDEVSEGLWFLADRQRSVFIARSRKRGVSLLLSSILSPAKARIKLAAYSLSPDSSADDPMVVDSLCRLAQDMRYLYPTAALSQS